MIRIHRTRNPRLVEKILRSDPRLWEAAGGIEFDALGAQFQDDPSRYCLVCVDDEAGTLGLCIFHPADTAGHYRAHANFLSKFWGKRELTEPAAKQCVEWMFEHTDCAVLEASIPDEYLPVQLFAERLGMQCVRMDEHGKHYELSKYGNAA